ncbi:MAG: enoyl-CoA hydratase/isomerase family protein [Alphaproteobacteria bacterium]|nr:enoyl-CoA hydratase/isomerase family protein [Alphaproteobacteria bacterium]
MSGQRDGEEALRIRKRGPLTILTINRPDANNALDDAVRGALLRACDRIAADEETGAVLLTGAGNEAFSTGYDLPQLAALTPAEAEALARTARTVCERLAGLDVPVIAAIKGACIGAGLELALHCDIRVARGDARFGFPGIGLGLPPGSAAVDRLGKLIGMGPASALFITGGVITAERAFMLGLVTNVVGIAEFDPAVMDFAGHIAALPRTALLQLKRMLKAAMLGAVPETVGAEALRRAFDEGEAGERLRAMFGGPAPGSAIH